MSDTDPILYVETNFLVAASFPHHPLHAAARRLLTGGPWRLMLPFPAACESHSTVARSANEFDTLMKAATEALDSLAGAGFLSLTGDDVQLLREGVASYLRRSFEDELLQVLSHPRLATLHYSDDATFEILEQVFSQTTLHGQDMADAYILAFVFRSASGYADDVPRIFMSANRSEFSPAVRKPRVPQRLYARYRVEYASSFDPEEARRAWQKRYGRPSPAP